MLALAPYLGGALAAGAFVAAVDSPLGGVIAVCAYLVSIKVSVSAARLRWLLPLAGLLSSLILPLAGTALTAGGWLLLLDQTIDVYALAGASVVGFVAVMVGNRLVASSTLIRVGVIGSPFESSRLREELASSSHGGFEVAATITPEDWPYQPDALSAPYLCSLSQVGLAIDQRDLELLVVTHEFPSSRVDEQLYQEVTTRPVRVMDLERFHEHRFGSVPLAEIDYAWFTELAGKHSRLLKRLAKRSLDIALALPALLAFVPLLGVYALLARRDGGPVLFRQQRVGQGGRPFTIYKLRTMTHAPDQSSDWTTSDDARITRSGRLLRRTHLDEAPQLWNIVKGDMSLVGPRPEQVAYVERLSREIPFYTQRHIVKPGLTGWSQVRLGYSGSVAGTAFKLCNDLYYVKHQSILLDVAILLETVRTLVADRQFAPPPPTSGTMLGEEGRQVIDGLQPDAIASGPLRRQHQHQS